MIDVRMTQGSILRRVSSVAMKVMNPENVDAQPTADADHHLWEVYVRAKLPIVHLDGGDAVGDIKVSIKGEGRYQCAREKVGSSATRARTNPAGDKLFHWRLYDVK